MREIKYRCWVVRESEDDEEIMPYMGDMSEVESFKSPFAEHRKGNIILLQYTGLTDRNGKEIYEGDIVKAVNKGWTRKFEIMWIEDRSRFKVWEGNQPNISFDLTCDTVIDFQVEVIGNIYENPELVSA